MRWHLLIHHIPPRPLYLRAKVRQRLSQVGAEALKSSVYALPSTAEALEDLQWIAQEIVSGGGEAHVMEASFLDAAAHEALVGQFKAARDADYERLATDARTAARAARRSGGTAADAHAKLARRFEQIRALDFFNAPKRAAAEKALAAFGKHIRNERKEELMPQKKPELRGKTWVTRPGVKVDRMASAWFIRRFVDAKAHFRFADPAAPRAANELRFDMVGGDFTHEGDRCTFETLIARVGLPDRGVKAIAEIIHDLDLKDDKYGRDETAGVRRLFDGILTRCQSDDERLERGYSLLDDLHEALQPKRPARK